MEILVGYKMLPNATRFAYGFSASLLHIPAEENPGYIYSTA